MPGLRIFEVGERYGRLTVIERRDTPVPTVRCRCDCGTVIDAPARYIGRTTNSCGCLKRGDGNGRWAGGKTEHPLYHIYNEMIARCHRPTHRRYADYGGRGITVCEQWRADFWSFVADVGERPDFGRGADGRSLATLDRIDNDSGYEPGNVRWATPVEQAGNKRGFGIEDRQRDDVTGQWLPGKGRTA